MNNIHDCVKAFVPLLDKKYCIVLGRKGVAVTLEIVFDKKDCFHLMGLQYLTDRPELSRDRSVVFDEIMQNKLTATHIESSVFYPKIQDRVHLLPYLEEILDRNDTIFKYNAKANSFSLIQAEYLMKNKMEGNNVYIFLSKNENDRYFCRSFFPEGQKDYTKNQASWTLLQKKKIEISTQKEIILFNRL